MLGRATTYERELKAEAEAGAGAGAGTGIGIKSSAERCALYRAWEETVALQQALREGARSCQKLLDSLC